MNVCAARFGEWNQKEVDFLNQHPMITAKPVVYLVNLTEKAFINKKSKVFPLVFACNFILFCNEFTAALPGGVLPELKNPNPTVL